MNMLNLLAIIAKVSDLPADCPKSATKECQCRDEETSVKRETAVLYELCAPLLVQ